MKVYHGSYTEIDVIDLAKCEAGRDFGRGFYVTGIRSQAEYRATRKGKSNGTDGFVTEFDYNENICRIMKMKLLHFSGYNEKWFDFVVLNRANPCSAEVVKNYCVGRRLCRRPIIIIELKVENGKLRVENITFHFQLSTPNTIRVSPR
jgi:hypothetical protein